MSFLVKQPQLPQSAANDLAPVSTYQEGNPIPLFFGREVFGSQWQSQPFNRKTAYGGANQPDWEYCSIIAGFAIGPVDFVGKLFRDGKEIANWDYNFPSGVNEHTFILNERLELGEAATVVVRRGSETQTPSANVIAGTGQNHPAYRGWVTLEFINIDLGKGNTSLPSFTVELGRHVPAIGPFAGGDSHPYGVNPIAAIYWLLKEPKGGYDVDPSLLNSTHWGTQANALESIGINGRTGPLVHCHPCFKSSKDAGALLSEILAYFDGYLYSDGDELKIGWFPHTAVDASTLPEIAEADLTIKPSGAGFPDWTQSPSGALVMFRDFDRNYQDAPALVPAPANRETGSSGTPVRSDRPLCHASDQAHMIAAEVSVSPPTDSATSLTVKKSRAVQSGGAPLMPGDLFNWDYGPWSLDLVCRVIGRRHRLGAAEDVLEIIRERGEFPRPYVAAVDARVLPTAIDPGEISTGDVRLWQLPTGFGTARQVAALINRVQREIIGAKLSFSPTGAAPWAEVLDQRYFAAKCVLTADISASATTVRVSSSSVDFSRFEAQSSVDQTDDTLLLLIDDELVSVGTKTVVSSGVYDLTILRKRQGTVNAMHASTAVAWLFYRYELRAATHIDFYRVRDSGDVYHTTIATKHFKIALMSADEVGLAKPDDPGLSLVLSDFSGAAVVDGILTFRQATAPTGTFPVGSLWYDTAHGNAPYRWDGTSWVYIGDERIDGAIDDIDEVRILLDQLADDMARKEIAATDYMSALIREVQKTRDTFVEIREEHSNEVEGFARDLAAMQVHFGDNWGVIAQEKKIRITERDAATAITTALQEAVGDSSSGIIHQLSLHNDDISALASDIEVLTSTLDDQTASVTILTEAYVIDGVATATWGFKLNGGGRVAGVQAVAASGGSQPEVAVIAFDDLDLRSGGFADGGDGWEIQSGGRAQFDDLLARGTFISGNPAGLHVWMDDASLMLSNGGSLEAFFGFVSGFVTLDLGGGNSSIQNVDHVLTNKVQVQSSYDPRTSDAPLKTEGGAWIAKSLDVGGDAGFGGDLTIDGDFAPKNIIGSGGGSSGWTVPMNDGSNWLQFRLNAGVVECLANFTTVIPLG